jgi:mannose-1-phosphate guanylyltransferase
VSTPNRWVVVLAGGVGSRFWPLSTPARPKQFLPLATAQPLLLDTVERLRPIAPAERTLILTNASLVAPTGALLSQLPADNIVAEPRPSGTAAALSWAALQIQKRDGPDAIMISVHADWAIKDEEGFRRALRAAADAAERYKSLITVGVVPTRADPGLGYIQPGDEVESGVRRVGRFVEKPDRERAEVMRTSGFLWNSGIFVWRVGDFLDEIRAHTPEIAPALAKHAHDAAAFFGAVRPVSVDVGVLERSSRVMVMAGDFGWDDVGTWGALRRVRVVDASNNAAQGDVYAVAASGNVVHGDKTVVLYGVSDLVVVAHEDLVLVTTVDRSADLKTLIEALPTRVRDRE